ncbi:MAG: hypothetical protein Q9176_007822 [Flavoplaca citrina]
MNEDVDYHLVQKDTKISDPPVDPDILLKRLIEQRVREAGTVASWKARRDGKRDVFEALQSCAGEFENLYYLAGHSWRSTRNLDWRPYPWGK